MFRSVNAKLYGGFGLVVLAVPVAGVVAITQLNVLGGKTKELADQSLKAKGMIGMLHMSMIVNRLENIVFMSVPEDMRHAHLLRVRGMEPTLIEMVGQLRAQESLNPRAHELLDQTEAKINEWYLAREQGSVVVTLAGDPAGGLQNALIEFHGESTRIAVDTQESALSAITLGTTLTITLSAVAVVVAGSIAFLLSRSIGRGVQQVAASAARTLACFRPARDFRSRLTLFLPLFHA